MRGTHSNKVSRGKVKGMRNVKVACVMTVLAIIALGCAGMGQRASTLQIEPDSVHEDCFAMEPGQVMQYAFESRLPLEFNVHFHEGAEVFYPVLKKDVTMDEGSYEAEKRNYYCLMWTNHKQEPVALIYTCTVK